MTQICMPDLSGEFHVRLVNELDDTSWPDDETPSGTIH